MDVVSFPFIDDVSGQKLTRQDRLNDLGFKPFKPLVEHLLDVFAPFDLQPAPDAEVASAQADWVGAYDESYAVPDDLTVRAASVDALRQSRTFGRPNEVKPLYELDSFKEDDETTDKDQVHKLTKTLAYLHSRGEPNSARVGAPQLTKM